MARQYYTNTTGYYNEGIWNGLSYKYIGLKVNIADKYYYAWIKVKIQIEGGSVKITILDCAINEFDVDISENQYQSFSIYPNPVKDNLTITKPMQIKKSVLTIFNLNSQALITKYLNDTKTVIDLSNLKKGSYILKITNDNYIEVKKIIKE